MRVLFASGIDGFCHRYNVLHWAEQLATQGVTSTAWANGDPRLAADLSTHDVLVLYRVPDSPWIQHLLAVARALGRPTVFAVDDLIVTPELINVPLLHGRDDDERRLWHEGVRRYRRTLDSTDALLTTTEPIAAVGHALGKPTHVQRGGLSTWELALGSSAARSRDDAAGRPVRLGYFSGTASHDHDLATIASDLADVMGRHPEVELLIVGPLVLPDILAALGARIQQRPLVPWTDLPALVASCTASLAPLEWQHPFVAAKGAIKYLEAGAVGVPVIASPTEAFRDAIRDGATGLLAADAGAWRRALATLVTAPARAADVGTAARADVERRFAPAAQGAGLASFLSGLVAGRRASRAATPTVGPLDERALVRAFPGEIARVGREPDARPDLTATAAAGATTLPLADGAVLTQRFAVRHAGLTRVDVQTVTYGLALDHTLHARLLRDDGSEVTAHAWWAGAAPNADWLAIEFAPEGDSANRLYTLELRARGTGVRNALSFGTSPEPALAPCTHDGAAGRGALALRTFAAWEAEAAGVRPARAAAPRA